MMDVKIHEDQVQHDKDVKIDKFVTQKRKRYRPLDIQENLRKKRKITWDLEEWVKCEIPRASHENHFISSLKLIQICKSHSISYLSADQTQLVRLCTWYDSYENEYFIVVMPFVMKNKIWKSSDHGFQFVKKKLNLPEDIDDKIKPLVMNDQWTWTLRNTETYATLTYTLPRWIDICSRKK